MLRIGCHLSSSRGYLAMGKQAVEIGANTFQFFTRNPRGGAVRPLDQADLSAYRAFADEHGLGPVLAHAPYTLNACAADERLRAFTRDAMREDLARLKLLPGSLYNFHPGSHVGQGADTGIRRIADLLNEVLAPGQGTVVLLETMAGKGSEVGGTFEELRDILDRVEQPQLLGVCLDTCHVYDGGYDLVHDLDGVLEEFDRRIGLNRLRAVHLNDSKNSLGSRKDRHEKIGLGSLGLESVVRILNHPLLRDKPFYLETPNDVVGYAAEIALLKGLYRES